MRAELFLICPPLWCVAHSNGAVIAPSVTKQLIERNRQSGVIEAYAGMAHGTHELHERAGGRHLGFIVIRSRRLGATRLKAPSPVFVCSVYFVGCLLQN